MNIKYEFLTGEVIEVEVADNIGEVLIEIEKDDYNSDRRETRRHNSIEGKQEKKLQFQAAGADIVTIIEEKEVSDNLHNALNKLLPQQKDLVQKVYFEGMSIAEIALNEGVGESAIRDRFKRIYKKLKNILN